MKTPRLMTRLLWAVAGGTLTYGEKSVVTLKTQQKGEGRRDEGSLGVKVLQLKQEAASCPGLRALSAESAVPEERIWE